MTMLNRSSRLAGKKSTEATDVNAKFTTLHLNGETPAPTWVEDLSPQNNYTAVNNRFGVNVNNERGRQGLMPSKFSPYTTGAYSVYFNGVNDYLSGGTATLPITTDTTFTMEAWVYMTDNPVGAVGYVVGDMQVASTLNYMSFGFASDRRLVFYWYDGAGKTLTSDKRFELNTWYHIAVCVNAARIQLFVNGEPQRSSGTKIITNRSGTTGLGIGLFNNGVGGFKGYISNLRITKNEALYTSRFVPQNYPLVASNNTSLLTCQDNRHVDNAFNIALTKGYGVEISSISPFTHYTDITYNPAGYSTYFDGTGDYVGATASSPELGLGTGDFTIECWMHPTANPANGVGTFAEFRTGVTATALTMRVNSSYQLVFYDGPANVETAFVSRTVSLNTWQHIAYVRISNMVYGYINGQLAGSVAVTSNLGSSQPLYIGANQTAGYNFNGYISNFRVVKGQALYTGVFTPPTAPLSLTSANATNTVGITGVPTDGNSVFFDGTNTYFNFSSPVDTAFRKGDFTWEGWWYPTSTASFLVLYDTSAAGDTTATGRFLLAMEIGGQVRLTTDAGTTVLLNSGSNVLTAGQWTHIAVVRSGTSGAMYFNGTSVATGTFSTDFLVASNNAADRPVIGANGYNLGNKWNGYVSNLRIVRGKALYTGAFTPTTRPLGLTQANTTNTVAMTGIPTNGESVYFGGGSGATGSYITLNKSIDLGNSDFTWEAWVNLPSFGKAQGYVICGQWSSGNGTDFSFSVSSTGILSAGGLNNASNFNVNSGNALVAGQWTHVAVVRNGTSYKLYINGVNDGATTNGSTITNNYGPFNIGDGSNHTGPEPDAKFLGYMHSLRVVVGTAIYTSNFTPSTTPLTAVTGTQLLACQGKVLTDNSGTSTFSTISGTVRVSNSQSPFGATPALLLFQNSKFYKDASINDFGMARAGNPRTSSISPFGTTPSLLACQSRLHLDNSVNNFPITVAGDSSTAPKNPFNLVPTVTLKSLNTTTLGSAYGDEGAAYGWLKVTPRVNNSFDFANTTPWTLETWLYRSAPSAALTIANQQQDCWKLATTTNYGINWQSNLSPRGPSTQFTTATDIVYANSWHHVAVTYNGSRSDPEGIKIYVDGQYRGWIKNVIPPDANTTLWIGQTQDPASPGGLNLDRGWLSDFRITKDVVYTGNLFVPPTKPLASTDKTVLSLFQTSQPADNTMFYDTSNWNYRANTWKSGNVTVGSFSPYGDGWSYYFDGNGDYLTGPASNPILYPGAGDFTIEYWLYHTTISTSAWQTHFSYATSGNVLRVFTAPPNNRIEVVVNTSAIINPPMPTAGTWQHWAFVRKNGIFSVYLNGSLTGSVASTTDFNTGTLTIGAENNGSFLNGYISNFRIVKGTALYTSNFTPTTTPLVASAPTGSLSTWSTSFNGSTDYLSLTPSFNLPTSTTPFTMEAYVYFNAFTGVAIASNPYTSGGIPFVMGMGTGSNQSAGATPWFGFYNGSSWVIAAQSSISLVTNRWYHIAYVYTGTTANIYVDGVNISSGFQSSWQTTAGTAGFYIGRRWDTFSSVYHSGYISNFRLTVGTAVYTSNNFIPPTGDLTAIPNTTILTCQDRLFIDRSTNNFTITKNGTPATTSTYNPFNRVINTSLITAQSSIIEDQSPNRLPITKSGDVATRKFTPSALSIPERNYYSYYFDGTGDNITVGNMGELAFGTYDFTVECWINLQGTQTTTNGWGIVGTYPGAGGYGWSIVVNRTSGGPYGVAFLGSPSQTTSVLGSTSVYLDTNRWYHIAVTRKDGIGQIWIDGVSTAGFNANYNESYHEKLYIGSQGAGQYFTGYITDLRIVRGTAIYTGSSFTRPTSPLTAVTNTKLLTVQSAANVDNSASAYPITPFGNPVPGNFDIPFAGTFSTFFNGSTSYLQLANETTRNSPETYPNFRAEKDFTLEFWAKPVSVGTRDIIFYGSRSHAYFADFGFKMDTEKGVIYIRTDTENVTTYTANYPASALIPNVWSHVAMVRKANILTTFVNGIPGTSVNAPGKIDPYSSRTDLASEQSVVIGSGTGNWASFTPSYFSGYISNLRFIKDTALYDTAATPFSVPIAPLGTTETVRNGVVQINQPTSYSIAFGTANVAPYNRDFIEIPNSAALTFATGNFTLEGWAYMPNVQTGGTGPYDQAWFTKGNPGQNDVLSVGFITGNFTYNTDQNSQYNLAPVSGNTWFHWAVQRFNNNWYAFAPYNGMQQLIGTFPIAATPVTEQQAPIYLGFNAGTLTSTVSFLFSNANIFTSAFISNMRLTKGQALFDTSGTYSTNVYVPSNAPLTTNTVGHVAVAANGVAANITGQVVLLTALTSTIQDISVNANPMFAVNNAKVSTWSPFNANGVLLLALQGNTLIDRSTFPLILNVNGDVRPTKISPYSARLAPKPRYWTPAENGSSYYFDGSGDFLSYTANTRSNFNNSRFTPIAHSDFCVECWVYMTGNNATLGSGIVTRQQPNGIGMYAITLQPTTGYVQGISSSVGNNNDIVARSTVALQTNTWVHLAYSRYANVFSLYYNGNIVARTFTTANLMTGGGDAINVGRANIAGTEFTGYISDIRITVDDTPYKTMFIPPTSPLIADSNTVILLRTVPGIVDWSGNKNIEIRGNVFLQSNVVRYNKRSIEFSDGTGLLAIQDGNFGQTGDFTIEGWWYPNRLANSVILSIGSEQASRISFNMYNLGSNVYTIYRDQFGGGGWSGFAGRKATIGGNVWNHIVFQRSANIFYTYINGMEAGNTLVNGFTIGNANGLYIGGGITGPSYQGYLDDFKIYNFAKYTSNTATISLPNASNYSAVKPYSDIGNIIFDALVVAGGGAGGYNTGFFAGGGGGGGGLIIKPLDIPLNANVEIVVGLGGPNILSSTNGPGVDGGNSAIVINGFRLIESVGGGGGGYPTDTIAGAGRAGGSGGGGARAGGGGNGYQGGATFAGQGFAGGTGIANDSSSAASGGGGAGGTINNPGGAAGAGGPGLYLTISGSNVAYAGGGGAAGGRLFTSGSGALGGVGGGGTGGNYTHPSSGTFGTPGGFATGGGGGGNGGRGGSGVVIIRHPANYGRRTTFNANSVILKDGYFIYTFTENGVLFNNRLPAPSNLNVEIFAVGGGGGGGIDTGGGGGGGGVYLANINLLSSSYTVSIGAGGGGAAATGSPGTSTAKNGAPGGNTTFVGNVFGSAYNLIAFGGGGGAGVSLVGLSQGSGGGGGGNGAAGGVPFNIRTGLQGQSGGTSPGNPSGGGGGGAGVAGSGANGGNGAQDWNGNYYGGGGGGGTWNGGSPAPGGSGGGGAGMYTGGQGGSTGNVNTGGGGGGANDFNSAGKNGGSGVVIIRYLGSQVATGGNVSSSSGYTYHTYNTSGTFRF